MHACASRALPACTSIRVYTRTYAHECVFQRVESGQCRFHGALFSKCARQGSMHADGIHAPRPRAGAIAFRTDAQV
eukprot:793683-Pleurochrysis_carterae.AAC.1